MIILSLFTTTFVLFFQMMHVQLHVLKTYQQVQNPEISSDMDETLAMQRNKIKEMTLHAWTNYKSYAWGQNELSPISKTSFNRGVFGKYNLGATIVDALDTLLLMNLTSEYEDGRNWIAKEFSMDGINARTSVFETNIRFVGGFLSLFALTNDPLYKDKAKYVADKLLPAFNTQTGIPYNNVNPKTGFCKQENSFLAEIGTLSLEFNYLTKITGDQKYSDRINRIQTFLDRIDKPNGLYFTCLDPRYGNWCSTQSTIGGLSDSFYEYLLKSWLQSDKKDVVSLKMFNEAMVGVRQSMIKVNPDNLTYVATVMGNSVIYHMDHLACFAGGLFALAGYSNSSYGLSSKYLEIGKELTKTCHAMYNTSYTGLGPEILHLANSIYSEPKGTFAYILRPETVESYFYLWRITHDPIYREWAWEAVQALEKYCRTPNGYSGIRNVYSEKVEYDDIQQSFFLAETLKYLYLIFSDDDVLPLDDWVFNTEAHPLPVFKS